MPLSRQTSRIVWPSKPSTTRPSTSMRIRGVLCGPLRRLRGDQPLGERVVARRDRVEHGRGVRPGLSSGWTGRVGARDEVGHQRGPAVAAPAATAIGVQTPAGQVERRRWSSSSDRKYRIPLVNGRVGQALVVAQGAGDDVVGEVRDEGRVRGLRACRSAIRSPISDRRRRPIRQGIDLPHASSAEKRVRSRARSTTQARSSAITTEPEPMWAPAARERVEVVRRVQEVRRGGGRRSGRRRGRP